MGFLANSIPTFSYWCPKMSETLDDEVEAINSIYGDNTITPSAQDQDPDIFILTIPGEPTSLRLQFPPEYPDVPPAVLGTYSTGEAGKRGSAVRVLTIFRDAVSDVFEPGQVCLYDALEKVHDLLAAVRAVEEEDEEEDGRRVVCFESDGDALSEQTIAGLTEPTRSAPGLSPPWTVSDPFIECKSVFVARCAPVSDVSHASSYLAHLLANDKRVRTATHNITAWRIRGPNGTSFQDCDDDGETAAGGRLLHLMQLMDLWDVMVVVTRWYGGQKLGPRRFALINQAARDAFVKANLVKEDPGSGKKKGGK